MLYIWIACECVTLLFQWEKISNVAAYGCNFIYKIRGQSITMGTSYFSNILFLIKYYLLLDCFLGILSLSVNREIR